MISIITPVLNGSLYIQDCIDTVIEQRYSNVEHLIIDGQSSDGTVDIIHRYADTYPHIRWISERDRGQSDAMNKGIALARGEIIGFLNVDDYYEPNVLGRVSEIFTVLPEPSLLVGNCNVWDNENRLLYVNRPTHLEFSHLLLGSNLFEMPLNPSAYFYNKSLHDHIGMYRIGEHYLMDLDFILRAVQHAHVRYVNEIWGNHRLLEGTKTLTDIRNGKHNERIHQLMKEYRSQLTPFARYIATLSSSIVNNRIIAPLIYFAKRPNELPIRLRRRIVSSIEKTAK